MNAGNETYRGGMEKVVGRRVEGKVTGGEEAKKRLEHCIDHPCQY